MTRQTIAAVNGKRGKRTLQVSGPFFVLQLRTKLQPPTKQPQPQGMTKMNQAQNHHTAAPSPTAQTFLCADCGGSVSFNREDLAFGLCGHCENRLNSRENKTEKPLHSAQNEGATGTLHNFLEVDEMLSQEKRLVKGGM